MALKYYSADINDFSEEAKLKVEMLVQPDYWEYRSDTQKTEPHPVLREIRVLQDNAIIYQAYAGHAAKAISSFLDMIQQSGIKLES